MSKANRKLKNFIINPKFQMKYLFWITANSLVLMLGYIYIFYKYTKENYTYLVDMLDMTAEARNQMHAELNQILYTLIFFSVIFLIFTSIVGIVFSHKVAGPLHKLNLIMDKIKAGNKGVRAHFRPGDEFQDLAQNFNEMMDTVVTEREENPEF
jgi:nitrogen fixation/metabolism regulation signal transduction histidine kinase